MPGPVVRRLLTTSAAMWAALRLALATLGIVHLSYLGVLGLAAAVLMATWIDLRRNTELILYQNLAVSPLPAAAVVIAVVLLLELAVGSPLAALLPPPAASPPA